MTTKEFESLTGALALNTIRYDRGEIDKKTFVQNTKVILGKEAFQRAIEIIDELDD